jgi:acid phosphatase
MTPENKSHLGLLLLSISALFLIPVTLAQDLPESTVSARLPDQFQAAFFPQSDLTMPHRPSNPPHKGDSFTPYPPQVPFDVAGYPVAPQNLQLEQVHVYVRHGTYQFPITRLRQSLILLCIGERTPVGIRLADPPANIPEHWMMCKTARRFKAAVTGFMNANPDTGEVLQTRKVVERRDGRVADGEWCILLFIYQGLVLKSCVQSTRRVDGYRETGASFEKALKYRS